MRKATSPRTSLRRSLPAIVLLAVLSAAWIPAQAPDEPKSEPRFVDLSLLVAPEYPCNWPTWPRFQINHYERIGPLSPYNSDILFIDGNTGTQLDVPPHSVALPETKLANSGPFGAAFTDKIPAWQFGGEACVIDCRDLLDTTPNGRSDLVKKERVMLWEKKQRPLGPGDVVLFYSGYSDKYYKPLPEGRRFAADPIEGKSPAWPDPDPDCMEYLATRKVMTLGTDSTSMGPLPDLAEPTHYAGLQPRHDLDRERHRSRGAAADRGVLLHDRPQARGRPLRRGAGIRRCRRSAGQTADRRCTQEDCGGPVGRPVGRAAHRMAGPGSGQSSPTVHAHALRLQCEHEVGL